MIIQIIQGKFDERRRGITLAVRKTAINQWCTALMTGGVNLPERRSVIPGMFFLLRFLAVAVRRWS